jgi:hypothetical protein
MLCGTNVILHAITMSSRRKGRAIHRPRHPAASVAMQRSQTPTYGYMTLWGDAGVNEAMFVNVADEAGSAMLVCLYPS